MNSSETEKTIERLKEQFGRKLWDLAQKGHDIGRLTGKMEVSFATGGISGKAKFTVEL